jgi:hypothetical protein
MPQQSHGIGVMKACGFAAIPNARAPERRDIICGVWLTGCGNGAYGMADASQRNKHYRSASDVNDVLASLRHRKRIGERQWWRDERINEAYRGIAVTAGSSHQGINKA